jgi:hypothetical protein
MVSFMLHSLCPWRKRFQHPANIKLGGLQSQGVDVIAKRERERERDLTSSRNLTPLIKP